MHQLTLSEGHPKAVDVALISSSLFDGSILSEACMWHGKDRHASSTCIAPPTPSPGVYARASPSPSGFSIARGKKRRMESGDEATCRCIGLETESHGPPSYESDPLVPDPILILSNPLLNLAPSLPGWWQSF